jgi:hypothetical protein
MRIRTGIDWGRRDERQSPIHTAQHPPVQCNTLYSATTTVVSYHYSVTTTVVSYHYSATTTVDCYHYSVNQ